LVFHKCLPAHLGKSELKKGSPLGKAARARPLYAAHGAHPHACGRMVFAKPAMARCKDGYVEVVVLDSASRLRTAK